MSTVTEAPRITEALNEGILGAVRQNLGVDADDPSKDHLIDEMGAGELFHRWCNWNGLLDWSERIRYVLKNIEMSTGERSA